MAPCLTFGQSTISGVVNDSRSGEPLPFATVYLNGTTKGTVTDNDGRFELNGVQFPSTLVFSFVGYKTQVLDLSRNPDTLHIKLSTNDNLPEVEITDYSGRQMYLDYFKTMFLGDDRWGHNAIIRNEDVIMFHNYGTVGTGTMFKAWAGEPIIIDLPLLGYELYVDLIDFTIQRIDGRSICDILGYFFYKPDSNLKKNQTAKTMKNRRAAYFNSNQHFLRSFYENRLAENGYILSMADSGEVVIEGITEFFPIETSLYSEINENGQMLIYGLNDKRLKIQYYHRLDGSPLDLTRHNPGIHPFSVSGIHLLKDTCTILSNGIITDNSIRFTGDISEKRIGASLPDDY
jgi:hypothetical protein